MKDLNDLLTLAENNDILVCELKLKRTSAASIKHGDDKAIFINKSDIKGSDDLKSKIAHEMGHCMTDEFYDAYSVVPMGRCERRATRWAANYIASREEVINAIRSGDSELWQLAEHFGVNKMFMIDILKEYNLWNGG